MESVAARTIYSRACQLSQSGVTPDFDRLLLEFDDLSMKNLLVDLDEQGRGKTFDAEGKLKPNAEPATRLKDLLDVLRRREQRRAVDQHAHSLRESKLGADEELAVLQQLIEKERARQGI